ncbi:hypothetical protein [Kribbella sp. NPDC051718]|uniref:hypothetical protein n=1 Tax=Kribbella sp. NPDC051718 TaxID=3155168 RepID=UPI00343DCE8D
MRTEPMVVEGLAGPVVIDVNAFTGKHSVTVGVQEVRGTRRGNYTLPTLDGQSVAAKLHSSLLDPHPSLEIAGTRYRTGPSLPLVVRVLVILPLVLLVGGLIGGLIGAAGIAANLGIVRGQQSTAVKSLLMVGVLILTVVVFAVLAAAIS